MQNLKGYQKVTICAHYTDPPYFGIRMAKVLNPITCGGGGGFLVHAITFLNAAQRRIHLES